MSEPRNTAPDRPSRSRDLATRVEEQGERIASLSREVDEVRRVLIDRDGELARARQEADVAREDLRAAREAQHEADKNAAHSVEEAKAVRLDAKRLAQEVVRLQQEMKQPASPGAPSPVVDAGVITDLQASIDAARDEVVRLRRESHIVTEALHRLRASYNEAETEFLALQRASNEMIATQYLDEVLQSILSGVEEGLGYDLAVLMVLDRAGGFFFLQVRAENPLAIGARGDAGVAFDRMRLPLRAEGNVLASLLENPTITLHDSPAPLLDGAEPKEMAERLSAYLIAKGERTFAAVPMVVRGQVAGALFCARSKPTVTAREREALQNFSNQAGMAIENAQLVNDMRRVRDELARKNDALSKTNDKLVELERAKEALTSMMVHDMKNPLTSIRGYLELLLDEPVEKLPDELKRHVKISYDSSGRLLDMVRDLLDISKMEAGMLKPAADTIDLKTLIETSFTELSVTATRSQKTIVTTLHDDLPAFKGDADLLGRVINNLLSNSVKHTPKGSRIEISARPAALVTGAPANCSVAIAIADNGEGIPKEFHERIFEKFGTVESRSTGAAKMSTGLGLTFCKMAIEAHGGKIWVESELGHGATFWIALPPTPPA